MLRKKQDLLNHKVVSVETVNLFEDVYDLSVEKYHNFALSSGVFVHNCFLATNSLLREMELRNMFKPPYSVARNHTCIADDHLLPIFVRMCGLEIQDVSKFASCYWNAKCDPRGLEEKGIAIFHPTKLRANNKNKSTEITIRNYFRKLRGCADLLV